MRFVVRYENNDIGTKKKVAQSNNSYQKIFFFIPCFNTEQVFPCREALVVPNEWGICTLHKILVFITDV